jgi:hypothetical protein
MRLLVAGTPTSPTSSFATPQLGENASDQYQFLLREVLVCPETSPLLNLLNSHPNTIQPHIISNYLEILNFIFKHKISCVSQIRDFLIPQLAKRFEFFLSLLNR